MWIIAFFILLGILLLIAELIVFSGTAVSGILSVFSFAAAAFFSWKYASTTGLIVTLILIVLLSILAAGICMYSKTWKNIALKNSIDSVSQDMPQNRLTKGTVALTVTRLAPMGKIEVDGELFEAKCLDAYVEPQTKVEITGFENFTVIVKVIK